MMYSSKQKLLRLFSVILTVFTVLIPLTPTVSAESDAGTGAITNREYVRNGGFYYSKVAWSIEGDSSFDFDKGNPGWAMMVGSTISWGDGKTDAFQELYLPDQVDRATFGLQFRYSLGPEPRTVNSFGLFLLALDGDNFVPLATSFFLEGVTTVDDTWKEAGYTLSKDELVALNRAIDNKQRTFLYIMFDARNVSAYVDNVTFAVDGSMDDIQTVGEIAFLEYGTKEKRPTIKRIKPDGSAEQTVWIHPATQTPTELSLFDIHWTPDATGISFISNHEDFYSSHLEDVYVVKPDGSDIRRITNMPSHDELGRNQYARGTVTGEIVNTSRFGSFSISPMLVYVQGAPAPVPIQPPAIGSSVHFTVHDVADLGPGVHQRITVFWSQSPLSSTSCVNGREFMVALMADVAPGQTVDAGSSSFTGQCHHFKMRNHTWNSDGSAIGYIDSVAAAFKMDAKGERFGQELFGGISATDMSWSPVDSRVLYNRAENGSGIWLSPTDMEGGSVAVNHPDAKDPLWLPDGSGFIFAQGGMLYLADIAGGEPQQLTPPLNGEAISRPSLSPDGRYLVYERQAVESNFMGESILARDVWILDLQNPLRTWPLTINGKSGSPSWSQAEPSMPAPDVVPIDGLNAIRSGSTQLGSATTFSATILQGSGVTYTWDFGDGHSAEGVSVQHTYESVGTFTATVTAGNSLSSKTASTQVTISAPTQTGHQIFLPNLVR